MAGALTAMIAAAFSGVTPDPYFEYTTLLLPGSGTNGTQNNSFVDSSANAFPITRNPLTGPNAPTQGTFSPFSQTGWGNYFDGTGDYLTTPDNAAYTVGSGDWTLEAWVYPTASPNQPIIVGQWSGGSDGSICMILSNDGNRYLRGLVYSGGTVDRISGSSLQLNAWNHCAFVREGTFLNLYLNGSRVDNYSFGSGSIQDSSLVMSIGAGSGGIVPFQGYISNCRFLKGTAQYTGATYTVPTAPLTAISGTSLLTCQSNRFKDNSTNNFTITRNGDTRVVAFSPFNPTESWSAATNGGSGYFDGSGDYLSMTSGVSLGSGDFTISCWVYLTAAPGIETAVGSSYNYYTSGNNGNFVFRVGTQNLWASFDGQSNSASISGTFSWQLNTWIYMAWVRSGSTVTVYRNGTSLGSTTDTKTLSNSANGYVIGVDRINGTVFNYLTGYMSGLRVLVGTADTAVPTSPFSSSGTSLLLAFTNAGIYDATSKNDLETVGNAQISTAQFQFAPSSMAFDGNGDYLIMPDAQTGQFLTGDFTVEYWCRFGSQGTNYAPQVGTLTSASLSGTWRFGTFTNNGGVYLAYHNGSAFVDVQFGSTAYNDNTWRHFALTRSGTTVRAFVNGTQVGTNQTVSQNFNSSNKVSVGAELLSPSYFNGYIQDMRITKYARYTANFTPPTAAFPTL